MSRLLDDLNLLEGQTVSDNERGASREQLFQAANRLRAFIEQHQPWYPPRQPGFGPWIEYDGKNGPRVDQVAAVLIKHDREAKVHHTDGCQVAHLFNWKRNDWSGRIVAFCVKEDQP